MGKKRSIKKSYAVSELVGGMILLVIAVATFASIYMSLFPPGPDIETNVKIEGYVNQEGLVVLSHKRGDAITTYNVSVFNYSSGKLIDYEILNDVWKIGASRRPFDLLNIDEENISRYVEVTVTYKNKEGDLEEIFRGTFDTEKNGGETTIPEGFEPQDPSLEDPMLLSSVKTNSVEEDLICYNDTVEAPLETKTYIYNWSVNNNPITRVLYPFDTNNISVAKDYSGNKLNATVQDANWISNGKLGGCYEFEQNDSILVPYCFDPNGYISKTTIEFWIKTSVNTQTICSFNGEDFWKLTLEGGGIKWITNSTDGISEISSNTDISDNNWHHIAISYDYSSGECAIYIDGIEDKKEQIHSQNTLIGNGDTPDGSIGTSDDNIIQETWNVLTYDDFESGMGNFEAGGGDSGYVDWYYHQGSYSGVIRDDNGYYSSIFHENGIDVDSTKYTSIKLDFWWMWNDYRGWFNPGWENSESWEIHYWDGTDWIVILDRNYPSGFSKDTWYHETLYINETDYNFPNDMKIRFECIAEGNNERVFLDEIYVNATVGSSSIANFSGLIDEFKIYNRKLTAEQIYQNYLCTKDGESDKSVIVSEETILGEIWGVTIIPNDSNQDFGSTYSEIQIEPYSGGG